MVLLATLSATLFGGGHADACADPRQIYGLAKSRGCM
jgi:hypothetical protein